MTFYVNLDGGVELLASFSVGTVNPERVAQKIENRRRAFHDLGFGAEAHKHKKINKKKSYRSISTRLSEDVPPDGAEQISEIWIDRNILT